MNEAHAEGISVSICGELAGDPGAAILLMAMGFDTLSMSATNLPKVKSVIRGISLKLAQELLTEVMTMSNADQIRERVEQALDDADVTRLIRPLGSDDFED